MSPRLPLRLTLAALCSLALFLTFQQTASVQSEGECAAPPSGLVAWYKAEYTAGDSAGGHNGTLVNGATYATGKVGQAFQFDGINDEVGTANNVLSMPAGLTLDAWVKADTQSANRRRIISVEGVYIISVNLNGTVECIADGNEFGTFAQSSRSIIDGGFHHVACTNDGATTRLYIDGVQDGTASESLFDINTLDRNIRIGNNAQGSSDYFKGLIDEVEIFSRALTAAEIEAIHDAGASGACRACVRVNGKIAFHSNRNGDYEIYTMNPDGTGQTRLTTSALDDTAPTFSPDGTKIAFRSDRDNNGEIYVMNADGTGQARLTNNPAADTYPSWSPDGLKIAFDSDRNGNFEIYVMNADGSNQTRLTNNSAHDFYPTFSPDGTRIAFDSLRDGNYEIYVMNADGSGQTRLTNNSASDSRPVFSPDGTRIAFVSTRDGNEEVYVMGADGSNQARLTSNPAADSYPAFSPDGTRITFTSTRDGNHEIYVMNADGTGVTRLTFVGAVDEYPSWGPVPAGGLDLTFNGTGARTFAVGPSFNAANGVALQPDGKIVLAGYSNASGQGNNFTVARLNPDGTHDTTFDGDGVFVYNASNDGDVAMDVAVQPDGKIVAVGYTNVPAGGGDNFLALRLNPNGTLDTTFDGDADGTVSLNFSNGGDRAYAVALQPDGKIVVAGYAVFSGQAEEILIARLNTNGTLDTTFTGDGETTLHNVAGSPDLARDVAVQPDGKIVAVGYSHNGASWNWAVARVNSDGSTDSGFTGAGTFGTDFGGGTDYAHDVTVLSDGKLLVAGLASNGADIDFALARYNSDGSPDVTFSDDGRLTTNLGGNDQGYAMEVQPDGRIVVGGFSETQANNRNFALARYNSDGSPDNTFDFDGKAVTSLGSNDEINDLAIQPDGRVVAVGYAVIGGVENFAVARYVESLEECVLPPDSDGDGVANDDDNCPLAYNPGQEDADSDSQGDACDADDDGDDAADGQDNCPAESNPNQEDTDGDGIGDACDPLNGCAAVPSNMAAWWPADGNAHDIQGPTFDNGTPQNGAGYAAGLSGQAFNFDGVDDSVDVGQLTGLTGANEITVMAWVRKTDHANGNAGIIGKWNPGQTNNTFVLYNNPRDGGGSVARFDVWFTNGSGLGVAGTADIPAGEWVHVAATWRNSDGRMAIYKNGVLDATSTGGVGQFLNSHSMYTARIGDWGAPTDSAFNFKGRIDEPQIFTRALSASEIASVYNAGTVGLCRSCTAPPSGMVSWWPGDGDASDIRGANEGTAVGGVTFAAGRVGQAFHLDGTSGYVRVPHHASLDPLAGSFSVDAWIKTTKSTGNQMIVSKWEGTGAIQGGNSFYELYLSNGKLVGDIRDTGNVRQTLLSTRTLSDGLYHHVAMVRDTGAGQFRIYVDGALEASAALTVTGQIKDDDGEADPFAIGAEALPQNFFSGQIDEVEYFNRALSAAEVAAIANAGRSGKCKDVDGDGVLDGQDNCPAESNPNQEDTDNDGQGDACDTDDDNDSVADASDNCKFAANANQANNDGDSLGDVCDSDDDNDTYVDEFDCQPFNGAVNPGAAEVCDGADNNCSGLIDEGFPNADGDSLADCVDSDDDNDSVPDEQDNCTVVANPGQSDADGDQIGDPCDVDDDGDGVSDSADACPSTPPGASVNPSGCTAGECYGPPSGMVAWWTGDGHAADVQGPTHENGTTLNGAGFADGKVGQSFSLDGIDDRVEIPDGPAVSPTGAITVDAWVKPDSITQPTAFVAKYDSSTSQISYFFGTNQGGKLEFYVSQSGTDSLARYALTDAEVITPGVFSHVAATFDPQTQAIRIFVNGQEVASSLVLSGTVTSVFDGTQPLYLGAYKNGAGVITGHFDGLMDEVELFNRALTPHEIKAIYDAGAAGKCKPPTADLSLTKSPSRSPAVVTRILTYTLAVKNWGPSPAQSVVVTDNLPTNAAYVSTITPVGTCARSGSTVTCQLGDMAPGQTVNVEVRVRPNQPATLTNTASVASQTFDPVSSNNSHTVQTQAVIAADLSIKKVASKDPSLVNQIFNYKLTVTNDGPATATGAVVTDNLPSGPTFMSAEPSQGTCSHAAGVVTCQLGSVASGAAATVIVRIRPRQAGTLVNTASVAGAEHDQDTSNNSATVTTSAIQSADLSVSKTESADPVLVGSQVTYTVKVTNNGFVAATGVTMTDTLPAGLGFVSAATSQGSVTSAPPAGSSGQVVVALGNISVGATATVTITVTANEPGAFTDSATAAGNEADHEPGNNTKKQTTTVVTLQKLLLSASTVVGGCQPYPTATVYLTGPAPAGGVTVSLSSTNAGASPQTTVFIPAGALKSAAFAVPTSPVLSVQSGSVRATLGAKTIGRSLTVTPGVCN